MNRRDLLTSAAGLLLAPATTGGQAVRGSSNDAFFADFESGTYNGWTLEGDCWDTAPASEQTFHGAIRGYQGKHFLCSFHPKLGGAATGKAVSTEFVIEKPFINYLIGGGNLPGEACINLVVEGKVVRTATGNDRRTLQPASWDVSSLAGKMAHFEVVDRSAAPDLGYIALDALAFEVSPKTALQAQMEKLVSIYRVSKNIPGVCVAASVNGKIVAAVSSGVRRIDDPDKTPITTFDSLMVGSISKVMTNTMIAALIQKGILSWETSFASVFPELRGKVEHPAFTAPLWMLLNHTSGLRRWAGFPNDNQTMSGTTWRRRDVLEAAFTTPAAGPAGAQFSYTAGCEVAVVMAERKTGQSYELLMDQYVYKPLGMKSAGMGLPAQITNPPLFPYSHVRSSDAPNGLKVELESWMTETNVGKYGPAGMIHCTIMDLCRFGTSYSVGWNSGGGALTAATYKHLLEVSAQPKDVARYTIGGWDGGGDWFLHGGMLDGHNSLLYINPTRELCVAFYRNVNLTNDTPWDEGVDTLRNEVTKWADRL